MNVMPGIAWSSEWWSNCDEKVKDQMSHLLVSAGDLSDRVTSAACTAQLSVALIAAEGCGRPSIANRGPFGQSKPTRDVGACVSAQRMSVEGENRVSGRSAGASERLGKLRRIEALLVTVFNVQRIQPLTRVTDMQP